MGAINPGPERLQFPPCFSISAFQHLLMNSFFFFFSSILFLSSRPSTTAGPSLVSGPCKITHYIQLESIGIWSRGLRLASSPTLLPGSLVSDRLVIRGRQSLSEPFLGSSSIKLSLSIRCFYFCVLRRIAHSPLLQLQARLRPALSLLFRKSQGPNSYLSRAFSYRECPRSRTSRYGLNRESGLSTGRAYECPYTQRCVVYRMFRRF
jgi:hypothetical protein